MIEIEKECICMCMLERERVMRYYVDFIVDIFGQ